MPFNYRSLNPERMTVESYERLYESTNTSRLIAFVGSGLSLVYGNYTWTEFIEQMIACLKADLKPLKVQQSMTADGDTLSRAKALIAAIEKDPSKDGIIVLELVRQAYELIEQLNKGDPDTSYQAALGHIFDGKAAFERKTLERRLEFAGCKNLKRKATSGNLYNLECIGELAEGTVGLDELVRRLGGEPALRGADLKQLPRDRRSLFSVFLAAAIMSGKDLTTILARERPCDPPDPRPLLDPLRELHDDLAVRRFFTTNYDFELEKLFMFADTAERNPETPLSVDRIRELIGDPEFTTPDGFEIVRHRPDGIAVRSDVNDGRDTAPLIEFAIGNVESFINIFHQHGRIDRPETIIAADGEYNRMYRAEGMSRRSLDQAYDLMLEGNPIVFVGSSVTEEELTRTLRHKVSNARMPGATPIYLLKEATGGAEDLLRDQLSYWTRLGVRVLYYGHPRRGLCYSLRRHLELLDAIARYFNVEEAYRPTRKWKPLCDEADQSFKLTSEDQDSLSRNYRLLFDLDFDRHVIEWLLSPPGREFGELVSGRNEGGTAKVSVNSRTQAALLIGDYLRMLAAKLHTAALRHELRQIGRDAKLFYQRKASLPKAREVVHTPWPGPSELQTRHLTGPSHPATNSGVGAKKWLWTTLRLDPDGATLDDSKRTRTSQDAGQLVADLLDRQKNEGASPASWTRHIIIGERGSAKGTLLRQLVGGLGCVSGVEGLIVNLCYGQEADSVVSLIRDYLVPKPENGLSRREHLLGFKKARRRPPNRSSSWAPWTGSSAPTTNHSARNSSGCSIS